MLIKDFVGKVVRVLWCDIPYVGFFLTIDNGNNTVLTDCKRYSNLTLYFDETVNTTDQQVDLVRLPNKDIQWMTTLRQDFVQVKAEFNNSVQRNFGKLFLVNHCLYCFKPKLMVPTDQRGEAMYALVGNQDVVLPDNPQVMQEFVENLPNNCFRCAGGNLTTINGRYFTVPNPQFVPIQPNNPEFQPEPAYINANLMEAIPHAAHDMGFPPMLPYLGVNNNYGLPPPVTGFFGENIGINPMQYYNHANMFPPTVQVFPNNLHFNPGNFNMPNPICGNPNIFGFEYPPPWQFPHPHYDEFESDDDEEDADPDVVIPNFHELPPPIPLPAPQLPHPYEINILRYQHDPELSFHGMF